MAAKAKVKPTFDTIAWRWMRYSGILLIPLAWIHVAIQDVIVGVHRIDLNYVALRLANLGWKSYDIALLAFAFAHGMYGLRQVSMDYFHTEKARRTLSILFLLFWVVLSIIGAIAVIAGARSAS